MLDRAKGGQLDYTNNTIGKLEHEAPKREGRRINRELKTKYRLYGNNRNKKKGNGNIQFSKEYWLYWSGVDGGDNAKVGIGSILEEDKKKSIPRTNQVNEKLLLI
ncbi:hypothetical protein JTB14_002295 [Gonioctena quinquepunctata]|nr:hypothetical protein JTB14_002295 [Gonioctena quinquepunctata]